MRRWQWIFCLLYGLSLLFSWLVMSHRSQSLPRDHQPWRELVVEELASTNTGRLRYRNFTGKDSNSFPVLLLHGSPMASESFDPLIQQLGDRRRLIVPDLPGFGQSLYDFTEFDFKAHAHAVQILLDDLDVPKVHIVAYSQGGGSAIEMAAAQPARVASLTLLSSVGVQEEELTGDYFLNHSLHGAQLVVLRALRWGVPHFGLLDRILLNTRYADNFYSADMRPLRGFLQQLKVPVLILHGKHDQSVPPSAALEHSRILPQSETHWFESGHMLLMRQPGQIASALNPFWSDVESGSAITRADATASRVAAANVPYNRASKLLSGSLLVVSLFAIAVSTLISEDLSCIGAGLLAGRGLIYLPWAIVACFAGIWLGDMLLYLIGRIGGRWMVERRPLRWLITAKSLEAASNRLERRGAETILLSRFIPGTRLPLYLAAGVLRLPVRKVMLWLAIAGVVWVVPVVGLISFFGKTVSDRLLERGYWFFPVVILFVICCLLLSRLLASLMTSDGRKMLQVKWLRRFRWEFWPRSVVYGLMSPVLAFIALRSRHLLAFTACNPGMPHSGVVGESKSEILNHLKPSGCVPPYQLLMGCSNDWADQISNWMCEHGLVFPIVLKPNSGERGAGVALVRNEDALQQELKRRNEATICQAYIEGPEFGILYIRPPESDKGFIYSVTRKIMTSVVGDGVRTLRQLILDDVRAKLSYRHFFEVHAARLMDVPTSGEQIELASLGSHCRGSLFLTGMDLVTDELEAEIDRISKNFKGFHLGRYDIRCPDEASLRAGQGLEIIELNGVTSEPTHIYHPHTPLLKGLRVLAGQWRWAYRIGLANAANGARISGTVEMLRLVFNQKKST